MCLIVLLGLLARLGAVALSCDPLTQYENKGQCCKRCGPGTRMLSENLSCLDPHCSPCEDNEYQEAYTEDVRCKTQPYCDPNKHFVYRNTAEKSKTSRSPCRCEPGHHCASVAECVRCAAHSRCGAGLRVQSRGDPTHDTLCEGCPAGTFSTGETEAAACTEWTVCGDGVQIEANGTATSDITCGEQRAEPGGRHKGTLILLLICLLLLTMFGITFCKFRGSAGKLKGCMEPCLPGKAEVAMDNVALPADNHVLITEIGPSLEEYRSLPEENELKEDLRESGRSLLTSNGNLVAQEDGKREALSQQESQMNSF